MNLTTREEHSVDSAAVRLYYHIFVRTTRNYNHFYINISYEPVFC